MLNERQRKELDEIRRRDGGVLHAASVVEYARDPEAAIHSWFTWDDNEAAEAFRLVQARNLIRYDIRVVVPSREPVRYHVSLTTDRTKGGGYREMTKVLSDREQRAVLLRDALSELERLRTKYQTLTELVPVWDAAQRVRLAAVPKGKAKPRRQVAAKPKAVAV